RIRVHCKYHEYVNRGKNDERQHHEKVPVARVHISTQQIRERSKRDRFPHGHARYHCERGENRQREVREFLQSVVLALMWMLLANEQVELHHLPRVANVAATRHEIAPLAMQIDEDHVRDTVHHEQPHHREVPVARAGEPSAERCPVRYRLPRKWITAERHAPPREHGIRVEDLQSASNHDHERYHIHPMCRADEPVMPVNCHVRAPPRGTARKRTECLRGLRYSSEFPMAHYGAQCILDLWSDHIKPWPSIAPSI